MKYAIVGHGRMGQAIELQAERRGHEGIARLGRGWEEGDGAAGLRGAEVAFEFSVPTAAARNVAALIDAGLSVVCGTTGWEPSPELLRKIARARVGVVIESNFSIGMRLFFRVVQTSARLFGAVGLHEPYIHEAHHRAKLDVPSGTARKLARLIREADPRVRLIREGNPDGPLEPGSLQVSSTRAGAEPGMHLIGFDGEHDLVTLRHAARGRDGFALGAVLAAEWLPGRPGLRTLDEWLDERLDGDEAGDKG